LNALARSPAPANPAPERAQDAEVWISRCLRHLMALSPGSPLDGTDWDDIAVDLHESLHRLTPEWAAATYVAFNRE